MTRRPLPVVALLCAAGFAVTFLVALHTGRGLHDDASLYERVSGNPSTPVERVGQRALATIDVGSVALAVLALGFLALARGRVARAAAAVAVVVCSVGSAEALKHGLPHVPQAVPAGRLASFPSGHTSVAVSLGLGLVLAVPPLLRPAAALAGAAYGAGIGLSLVALGWHYPSDVVGSFFVCGFWASVAGALLGVVPARAAVSTRGIALALATVAAGLAVAAVIAGRHPVAVDAVRSRPALVVTAAGLGLLSVALFGTLAALVEERRT